MAPTIIDDEAKLRALLTRIATRLQEEHEQPIFVDLEGVNLSRHGVVAIMQMLVPPNPAVYLIDVHVLGVNAFDLTADNGISIRSVLESKTTFKVFFDIRNDSDALHAHFGVNVAGVIDLQVIEYATRQPRGRFVNGLAKCIENDLPYTPGWSLIKAKGRRLFAPEVGGKYEVFLERPIAEDIVKYCEQDVMLMPQLLARYGPNIGSGIAPQIQIVVDERIRLSKSTIFKGKGRHMAVGPNLLPARNDANTPTSPEVRLLCSSRLAQLCRIDHSHVDDLISQFNVLQVQHETTIIPASATSSLISAASTEATSATPTAASTVHSPAVISTGTADVDDERNCGESFDDGDRDWCTSDTDAARDSDSDSARDYTACSADDCGYCGKCEY